MTLQDRIDLCIAVGNQMVLNTPLRKEVLHSASLHNNWFDLKNTEAAFLQVATSYLDADKLHKWVNAYQWSDPVPKRIGLVMAGNIPLVGFHDVLAVFIQGHYAKLKLSQKDLHLWPFILRLFSDLNPESAPYFEIVERLHDIDAVIATGSDNASRYFHYYFDRYPHIIRKNRVGVAFLSGHESESDLQALADDVFQFYGLGCRNVASIFVPKEYDFVPLLRAWDRYSYLRDHTSYRNNFDYNLAIYIMNGVPYMANDVVMLLENDSLVSRLACVHYQFYEDVADVIQAIQRQQDQIQVVVAQSSLPGIKTILPGTAQCPGLMDYADGVDTMSFLKNL